MAERKHATSYPLRVSDDLKVLAKQEAHKNRRSLNAELGLLIEEGLKWREAQKKSVA